MRSLLPILVLFLTCTARAQVPPREPSVQEVLVMARRAAGTLGPERTRELCKRARLSGLVPTLRFASRRGLSQDTSLSSTITADRTNASAGDDVSFEAGLTFELPRLVFASEEVRLLSVERWLVNDLRRFLQDVTHLYFQRRQLMRERATSPAPDAELDAQIEELEALLDAFTDGGFSRALPPRPPPPPLGPYQGQGQLPPSAPPRAPAEPAVPAPSGPPVPAPSAP
jgi:hypothetical protein